MKSIPLVSIVIPALDPKNFPRALNSAVTQNYPRLEVVVCDDSQGSEIREAVDTARARLPAGVSLRYVANPKVLGLNETVKECVRLATGEFLKVLFDEDWLMPEHTPLLMNMLLAQPGMVLATSQRYFTDAANRTLPNRVENSGYVMGDTRLKGTDLLSMFEIWPTNFIGGLSCVIARRADISPLIPALLDSNAPFEMMLPLMLYCCLLPRGDLGIVDKYLAVERINPLRLAAVADPQEAVQSEYYAMLQFLKGRDGERAEKAGGVRYVALEAGQGAAQGWEEMSLGRVFGVQADTLHDHVGVDCDSYDAVYEQWLQCRDFTPAQLQSLPARVDSWPRQAKIIPVIIDDQGGEHLQATLDSLGKQTWSPEAILVLSASVTEPAITGNALSMPLNRDWPLQLNTVLGELDGFDWFCLLRAGDELSPHALLLLAERIAERDQMQACYWDEDALEADGYRAPVFRPDFNLDLMRSYPYVGRGLAFSREALTRNDGFAAGLIELSPHDLLLRLVEQHGPHSIEHIGDVLLHARQNFALWLRESSVRDGNAILVARHLERLGVAHEIGHAELHLINRVRYLHEGQPLVSVLVASQGRLRGLQTCLESLLAHTAYTQFEVLVISPADEPQDVRDWLQAMAEIGGAKLRIIAAPAAANLSALLNLGARHARGEYLLTLTQDAVIVDGGWLDELLAQGRRSEVGVVGARLVAPTGTIEHAGLVLGLRGAVGSVFVGEPANSAGYLHRLQVVQNYSAVSHQCLLIARSLFEQVDGLDEGEMAYGFADADLCLRAAQQGYLVVWTPFATVQVAGAGQAPDAQALAHWHTCQKEAFRRWLPKLARDPSYNRNLSLVGASFTMHVGQRHSWQPFARHTRPFVLGLPINKGAVGHYRLIQPLVELERAGLASGLINYGTPALVDLERLKPDTIVFQGRYSKGPVDGIAQVKEFIDAFRVYEIDDYLLDVPAQNEHRRYLARDIRQTLARGVGLCDRLVVSTESLAEAMSSMHTDIVVVPNMLPPERWRDLRSQRRVGRKPRVGWGGGTSHTGDLLLIKDVVKALADEVEWVFLGMCPPELMPYVHEYHPSVPLHLYPQKMASLNLDLALAPLEQHIFNDCKSNLRLLEYGACGYPVVCTDTRSYRGQFPVTLVKTNSTHEWLEAIRMHLADLDASAREGDALRQVVLDKFMLHGDALNQWLKAWQA